MISRVSDLTSVPAEQSPPRRPRRSDPVFDVCIIGAGWSGLLACKYALANGLSAVVLEKRPSLGGVWQYSPDPGIVTTMASTVTSSSATLTEASDFYMPPSAGNFLHHTDVLDYLNAYAERFDLQRHIRYGRAVTETRRAENHWLTETSTDHLRSRYLVVCTGVHQRPRPVPEALRGFGGALHQAGAIKTVTRSDFSASDHVLVYGGGETASDIVEQLAGTEASVTWAIPSGQHFFRKASILRRRAEGVFDRFDPPLDEASSPCIQYVSPFHKSKPGMRWLCIYASTGSFLGYQGHGIPAWKNDIPFMHAFLNKNGHVVDLVHAGRVKPAGPVSHCDGRRVSFVDGSTDTFTTVIACTGYMFDCSFLPDAVRHTPITNRYKLIFDTDEPSLLFIGFARPTVSSIPLMTELQCQYAFRVLAGSRALPDRDSMRRVVVADNAARNEFFYGRSRPETLVDPGTYAYDVATLAGTRPNYRGMLPRHPVRFFKTFFSPMSAAHFALSDPAVAEAAVRQIWRRQHWSWFVFPFIYLFARLLMVDRVLDACMARKHRRALRATRSASRDPVRRFHGSNGRQSATPHLG